MDLSELNESDLKLLKSHIQSLCRYILRRREMFRSYLDECDTDPTLKQVAKATIHWSITDIAKDLSDLGFTHDALNLLRIRAKVDVPGMLFILDTALRRLVNDYPQEWTAVDVEELAQFNWKSLADLRAWIIIQCFCDEGGHHIFGEEDSENIKEISPDELAGIFSKCMRLSNVPWLEQEENSSKGESNSTAQDGQQTKGMADALAAVQERELDKIDFVILTEFAKWRDKGGNKNDRPTRASLVRFIKEKCGLDFSHSGVGSRIKKLIPKWLDNPYSDEIKRQRNTRGFAQGEEDDLSGNTHKF